MTGPYQRIDQNGVMHARLLFILILLLLLLSWRQAQIRARSSRSARFGTGQPRLYVGRHELDKLDARELT